MSDTPGWVTLHEATHLSGLSEKTLRRWIHADKLRHRTDRHGRYLVAADELPEPEQEREPIDELAALRRQVAELERRLRALEERQPSPHQRPPAEHSTSGDSTTHYSAPSLMPSGASVEHHSPPVIHYSANLVQTPPTAPGHFRTRVAVGEFLQRHGVPGNTARGWWKDAPWPALPRDALTEVLRRLAEPDAFRHRWRPNFGRCQDPECICREMLRGD